MGIEGGKRKGESPENLKSREKLKIRPEEQEVRFEKQEVRPEIKPEIKPEGWISGIINPEKLTRYRKIPEFEGHTDEWIIMQTLSATLVEKGPEMDPRMRKRLKGLVAAYRVLMIPNLNKRELDFMKELAKAAVWSQLETKKITSENVEDVRWIYQTFGLKIPKETKMIDVFGEAGKEMQKFFPESKKIKDLSEK